MIYTEGHTAGTGFTLKLEPGMQPRDVLFIQACKISRQLGVVVEFTLNGATYHCNRTMVYSQPQSGDGPPDAFRVWDVDTTSAGSTVVERVVEEVRS